MRHSEIESTVKRARSATRAVWFFGDVESPVHSLPGATISILTPKSDMDNQWKRQHTILE